MSMKKAVSLTTNIITRMKSTRLSSPKWSKSPERNNKMSSQFLPKHNYLNRLQRKWKKKNSKLTSISVRKLCWTMVCLHRPSPKVRLSPSRLPILKMSKETSLHRPQKFSLKRSPRRRHRKLTVRVSCTIKYRNSLHQRTRRQPSTAKASLRGSSNNA